MEFGVRELVQFGTLLASLAGAFAVVKSQLARVIQDIKNMNTELHELNTRLDKTEADSAVIKHQNEVFGDILSPANLKKSGQSHLGIEQASTIKTLLYSIPFSSKKS